MGSIENSSFLTNLRLDLSPLKKNDEIKTSNFSFSNNYNLAPMQIVYKERNEPHFEEIKQSIIDGLADKNQKTKEDFFKNIAFVSLKDGKITNIIAGDEHTVILKEKKDAGQSIKAKMADGTEISHNLEGVEVKTFTLEELGVLSKALNQYFVRVLLDRKLKEDPNSSKLPDDRPEVSRSKFDSHTLRKLTSAVPKPDPDFTEKLLITVMRELDIAHRKQALKEIQKEKFDKSMEKEHESVEIVNERHEKLQEEIQFNNEKHAAIHPTEHHQEQKNDSNR